jgi:thiol:disulfide interchange protein
MTKSKLANWFLLIGVAITSFAMVAIPVWLIQPFAPQTDRAIEISYYLRNWSPILTIVFAIVSVIAAVFIWRNSRWFAKVALVVPLLLIGFSAWFAQQNHFLWMFNPLANSSYVKASEAKFVKDDDFVMAVDINGEAVAYPILQMAYHHVVQDVVGGKPITATY